MQPNIESTLTLDHISFLSGNWCAYVFQQAFYEGSDRLIYLTLFVRITSL